MIDYHLPVIVDVVGRTPDIRRAQVDDLAVRPKNGVPCPVGDAGLTYNVTVVVDRVGMRLEPAERSQVRDRVRGRAGRFRSLVALTRAVKAARPTAPGITNAPTRQTGGYAYEPLRTVLAASIRAATTVLSGTRIRARSLRIVAVTAHGWLCLYQCETREDHASRPITADHAHSPSAPCPTLGW